LKPGDKKTKHHTGNGVKMQSLSQELKLKWNGWRFSENCWK